MKEGDLQPPPAPPFTPLEYSVWPNLPPELHGSEIPRGRWGVLLCVDRRAANWTLLGDAGYVDGLRGFAHPADPELLAEHERAHPSPPGISSCRRHGSMSVVIPAPTLADFAAAWAIPGWPDAWLDLPPAFVVRLEAG